MRTKEQTIEAVDKFLKDVFEKAAPDVWLTMPNWEFGFIDYPSYKDVINCLIKKYKYSKEYIHQLILDCWKYKIEGDGEEFSTPGDLVGAIKYNIVESIDVNEGDADFRREEYEDYLNDLTEDEENEDEEEYVPIEERVINFIKRFQNEGTIKTFTQGCCYWFAKILDERFNAFEHESGIMYNGIDNHFATLISGKLYDITGQIKFTKKWETWYDYTKKDDLVTERIFNDCIDF